METNMKKQLEAIREIEETNRRKSLTEILADIDSGKHWHNLRKQFNAVGVTAEAYAVSELCKCDIYVNGDQIAWEVMQVFPEASKRQALTWLCQHAEEHHEISVTI